MPLTALTPDGAPGRGDARRRVDIVLRAYGSEATWDDVLRIAVIRLVDLARISREKAEELSKPHLHGDADRYERDADYLAGLRQDG